jgi:hypothetical protein
LIRCKTHSASSIPRRGGASSRGPANQSTGWKRGHLTKITLEKPIAQSPRSSGLSLGLNLPACCPASPRLKESEVFNRRAADCCHNTARFTEQPARNRGIHCALCIPASRHKLIAVNASTSSHVFRIPASHKSTESYGVRRTDYIRPNPGRSGLVSVCMEVRAIHINNVGFGGTQLRSDKLIPFPRRRAGPANMDS